MGLDSPREIRKGTKNVSPITETKSGKKAKGSGQSNTGMVFHDERVGKNVLSLNGGGTGGKEKGGRGQNTKCPFELWMEGAFKGGKGGKLCIGETVYVTKGGICPRKEKAVKTRTNNKGEVQRAEEPGSRTLGGSGKY